MTHADRKYTAAQELADIREQFKPIPATIMFVPTTDSDSAACEGCVARHDAVLCCQLGDCTGGVYKLEVGE